MQIGSRSATALVCNLLQVNLLQKHRWLTIHRNDSSATLASLPVCPNHVISWIFPSCNCKSVPIMSLLDILLCFLTNMLHMSLRVSFTMSLQARFPYVIASVLLTCHYSILYHVVTSPFFICHCEERIEATWQSSASSPPGCARPASGLHGRAPPLFAASCRLICYKNHWWLTMHRNDSSATIASLPVCPNHVISWIFPSCNCKSVTIMSLLDILLCFLTNMLHMSLQVSFTMSLQARFPYVIASVLLTCHYSILYHFITSPFFIYHCEERIEATWQSSDSSSPGCGRQCKSEAGRAPPLFATSCKLICYKNICG